ncbi:YSIRK-type signal peptide-containing protein [Aerococcus sp. UMB8608]|uniref:YSIRK-type signal peptide-containing protein n=1 Tax=Aerococcus sanguinicola TaxID=119206 RepID=A0A5N1GNU1_9LACT|nr:MULTISPECIES: YSIRK-type signal peptide-containing protein [Aerococcus]KAA9301929.1 YSIRK-type signal peptide-containing protein [Aerococcus sanguinicola]MDK6368648.1 YSIRK-type signal peptide-containing protein [Aerococcus sp. UMB9870]MDK6679731.1 YSIRK-type signal peptide-containing protein [Aerococcus sp. UMB8608]MDK6685997.1 YSIRK-type signal peptide-containing protein [Aerococcus sp. UMB8623]MDK6940803.1 YSIRK-type signal peptide-containing protein [Aerococcus sp. UMB8487]
MKNKENTLSFRKLNLGLASVAIAGFLAANPQVVEATGTAAAGDTTATTATTTAAPTDQAGNAAYEIQDPKQAERTLELIRNTRNSYYDDESVPFEGTSLKNYVTQKGLNKEEYVNGISYDRMLEKDAYIRAEETAIHGLTEHKAPDKVSDPQYHNSSAWGENLSWGHSNLEADFEAWTSAELPALKDAKGIWTEQNGHLYQILNPSNISFGYGTFSKLTPGVDASKYETKYNRIAALTLSYQPGDTNYEAGKIGGTVKPDSEPTPDSNPDSIKNQDQSNNNNSDVNPSNDKPLTDKDTDKTNPGQQGPDQKQDKNNNNNAKPSTDTTSKDPKKETTNQPGSTNSSSTTTTTPGQPSKPTTPPSAVAPTNTKPTTAAPTTATPSAVAPSQNLDKPSPGKDQAAQAPASEVKPSLSPAKDQAPALKPGNVAASAPKAAKPGQAKASRTQPTNSVLPKTGAVAVSFTGFGLALVAAGAALLKRRK